MLSSLYYIALSVMLHIIPYLTLLKKISAVDIVSKKEPNKLIMPSVSYVHSLKEFCLFNNFVGS